MGGPCCGSGQGLELGWAPSSALGWFMAAEQAVLGHRGGNLQFHCSPCPVAPCRFEKSDLLQNCPTQFLGYRRVKLPSHPAPASSQPNPLYFYSPPPAPGPDSAMAKALSLSVTVQGAGISQGWHLGKVNISCPMELLTWKISSNSL